MMFNYKFKKIVGILLLSIILIESVISVNLIFKKEMTKLERNINSKKLGNYLRKMFMIKNNLINNDVIFLENKDFSIVKKEEDINFTNMQNLDDKFELKARLSALTWVRNKFEDDNFKPYGVSIDKEHIEGWKNYLILMIGSAGKHKLVKVCITTTIEDDFSIVTSYDKKCERKINILKKYNLLSDMSLRNRKIDKKVNKSSLNINNRNKFLKSNNKPKINKIQSELMMNNSLSEQLKSYQEKLAKLAIENEIKTKNLELLKKKNEELEKIKTNMERKKQLLPKSFIEKNFEEASLIVKSKNDFINKEAKSTKFFSLDSLSLKFSVDELKKIKSLIKFAKLNKIMDTVYQKNGDISVNELINPNNVLLSFDKDNNYNIKNMMTTFFKNFTDSYHLEEQNVRSEIMGLKVKVDLNKNIETEQQSRLQEYFGRMGDNVNMIKNLMIFVKELSGEFQKSMLVFGNTLGSLSERMKNVTQKIDKIEGKFSNLTEKMTNISHKLTGNTTNKYISQNELMKLIMENSTKTILNEYHTSLRKEVNNTLTTTLNYIKNISNNITNLIENSKKQIVIESPIKSKNLVKEQNTKQVSSEIDRLKNRSIQNIKKKYNLRNVRQPLQFKEETKSLMDETTKDSLSQEDEEFDSSASKPTVNKFTKVKGEKVKEETREDYLEP